MPAPDPATMITALSTALSSTPAGVVNIRFADGRSVQYDRNQALAELAYWQRQLSAQTSSLGGLQMQRCQCKGDA